MRRVLTTAAGVLSLSFVSLAGMYVGSVRLPAFAEASAGLARTRVHRASDSGQAVLYAQAPTSQTQSIYQRNCASCHGAALTGAKAPSILAWVRFHVDKEIVEIVRKG